MTKSSTPVDERLALLARENAPQTARIRQLERKEVRLIAVARGRE